MWRSLVCVGVALGVVGIGMAQDRSSRRDIRKGQVVRVVPDKNIVVMRVGTGTEAKEYEYRVSTTTKYWGTDKRALSDGLRYQGFREGTAIWFDPGTAADSRVISELWFYEPGEPTTTDEKVIYLEGKIVRVDPATGMVVIRTGTGAEVKENEYTVNTTTKYWGTDQQPFTTGLRYGGFREGTQIWYRVGPGERNRFMSEIRFYDPGRRGTIVPRKR